MEEQKLVKRDEIEKAFEEAMVMAGASDFDGSGVIVVIGCLHVRFNSVYV